MKGNPLRFVVIAMAMIIGWSALTCSGTYAVPEQAAPDQSPSPVTPSPVTKEGEGMTATICTPAVKSRDGQSDNSPFAPPPVLNPVGMTAEDATIRPFLYWRAWADQRLPFYRVFFFLLLVVNAISLLMPRLITAARQPYESKWFRCFGIGVLFFTIGPAAAGTMARLGLYTPLATLVIAIVQLASLIGLTVAAQATGDSLFRLLGINSVIKHPLLNRAAALCAGATALSLISLIPGIGQMPRLGNRMLALVAAAGTGGLLMLLLKLRARLNTAS